MSLDKLKDILVKKHYLSTLLILILTIVFIFYSYDLNNYNLSLYCDEADIGLNALCISQSLHDCNNEFLPLYIKTLGYASLKNPVYIYFTAIIIKIAGLDVYTTRLPAIIFAMITILFLFLITRKLFNPYVAIISCFLLTFTPGFFHIHRVAFELCSFSACFLGFLLFYLEFKDNKKLFYLLLSILFFLFAWYSYVPSKVFMVFTILIFFVFLLISDKEKVICCIKQNTSILIVTITGIVLFLFLPDLLLTGNNPHFKAFQLFGKDQITLNEVYSIVTLKESFPFIYQWLYNSPKIFSEIYIFTINYLNSYSPKTLFLSGDLNPRHIIPYCGPLPLLLLFLIPTGIFVILKNYKENKYKFLLSALIAIGIPSGFIITHIELTHNSFMYPVFALISALGGYYIFQSLTNKLWLKIFVVTISAIAIILPFLLYYHIYFTTFNKEYQQYWESNRDKIVTYIKNNHYKYAKVYFSETFHGLEHHFLFYSSTLYNYPISKFQVNKELPYNIERIHIKNIAIKTFYSDNINAKRQKSILILNPEQDQINCIPINIVYYNNKKPLAVFCEFNY